MVGLEGMERSHIVVCIHVAGEGVDGSGSNGLHIGLYFRHWEVIDAKFCC